MNWLNFISSSFGFLGTILIFRYGIPNKIRTSGGVIFLVKANSKEEEIALKKEEFSYVVKSHLGLIFLTISFIVQIAASFN